jgi:hypothetical protein
MLVVRLLQRLSFQARITVITTAFTRSLPDVTAFICKSPTPLPDWCWLWYCTAQRFIILVATTSTIVPKPQQNGAVACACYPLADSAIHTVCKHQQALQLALLYTSFFCTHSTAALASTQTQHPCSLGHAGAGVSGAHRLHSPCQEWLLQEWSKLQCQPAQRFTSVASEQGIRHHLPVPAGAQHASAQAAETVQHVSSSQDWLPLVLVCAGCCG